MLYARALIVAFISLTLVLEVESQSYDPQGPRFMFWNVENLFDTEDDPVTDDNDFLPAGVMRWNKKRYWKKINDLYKTITAAGEWTPPDVIALCEIENRSVIEDLINHTYLSRYDYGIIHEDSPDKRGIDVGLIFRKDRVSIAGYNYLIPEGLTWNTLGSRTVLYSGIIFRGTDDTIHLFFNHWPSRIGGVLAREDMRLKFASLVRIKSDSISFSRKGMAKIIVAGDFNCTPEEREMAHLTLSSGARFVNLTARFSNEGLGTYRYQGTWEMLDQVLVSDYFLSCGEGAYADTRSAQIFSPYFLVTKDPNYPGNAPFSMYRGRRYRGGVSDHYPLLFDCRTRPRVQE